MEKRENPKWDVETIHYELIDALETVANQHKSEYSHYDMLMNILKAAKVVEGKRDVGSTFDSNQR